MKKYLSSLLAIISVNGAFAQAEFTLYNMEHVYQSSYVNPTAIPDHKVSVGLPGLSSIYLGFANSNFAFNDLIDASSGVRKFSPDKFRERSNLGTNILYAGVSTDLFHLRFKARKTFISFNISTKSSNYFSLPADAVNLLTLDYINTDKTPKQLNVSDLAVQASVYNEYGIGFTTFQKKFIISVHAKVLQGLYNMDVDFTGTKVNFDEFYGFNMKGVGSIKYSGRIPNFGNPNGALGSLGNFNNLGFGGDIGVTYMFRSNVHFSVGVNNIGFITWKDNASRIDFNEGLNFTGLPIFEGIFQGNGLAINDYVSNISGGLTSSTDFNFKPSGAYTTVLPANAYIGGKIFFTPRFTFSTTLFLNNFKGIRPGVSVGLQYKLGRIFSLTGTASVMYNKLNFGGGIVLKPGPFQIYVVTDNINAILEPLNANSIAVRTGINLVFGREHLVQKQPFNP